MADPARYHIDITHGDNGYDLLVERGASGQWVKWLDFVDYKSAQRRNASLEANTALGMEVAHLRAEVIRLNERIEAMRKVAVEDSTGLWLHPAFKND